MFQFYYHTPYFDRTQLAKIKKYIILHIPAIRHKVEAVGLFFSMIFKKYDFCEYVNVGQFRENLILGQ